MDDLELAENELKSRKVNLVIVKNGVVLYQSEASGMKGILQAIEAVSYTHLTLPTNREV